MRGAYLGAALAAMTLTEAASAREVVWPIPPCSAQTLASASPAPRLSDGEALKGGLVSREAPPGAAMRPPAESVAYVVGLDAENRPRIKCVKPEPGIIQLVHAFAPVIADLKFAQPETPSREPDGGAYLVRIRPGHQAAEITPPPAQPIIARCPALAPLADEEDREGNRPTPSSRSTPIYPAVAQAEEIEGAVTIIFDVFSNGAASPACIAGASPAGWFEQATLDAARQWRFETRQGMGRYGVTFRFKLR